MLILKSLKQQNQYQVALIILQ